MSLSDPSPKLPRWIFFLTDAVLVAAAVFLALESRRPLAPGVVYAIAGCVFVGAIIGLVPLIAGYEREKNDALAERQNALEALSRTVATSAEQISIAANGLHEIAELAHRNLRQAEQLPHKLQEKIAEFQAQLDNAREDEREELEKEIAELRAGETDQLGAAAEKVRTALAELARAEAAAQKQLAAMREAVADTPARISAALEQAASASAGRVSAAEAAASAALETAARRSLEAIQQAVADADARLAARVTAAVATLVAAVPAMPVAAAPVVPPVSDAPITPAEATPPRRPRKSRRDEPAGEHAAASSAVDPEATPSQPDVAAASEPPSEPPLDQDAAPASTGVENTAAPAETPVEPPPVAVEHIALVEPVAPRSADPFTGGESAATTEIPPESPLVAPEEPAAPAGTPAAPASDPLPPAAPPAPGPAAEAAAEAVTPPPPAEPAPAPATHDVSVEPVATPPAEPPKPPRKRGPRKSESAEPSLALPLDGEDFSLSASEDAPATASEVIERVISSDGATRLLVTAYIGIGNRLFIRGRGPGLSWEKGVPLQFVSIGKWRWETADATEPLQFKLYKNDDLECTALGTITLEPGHQQEVSARF